MTVALAQTAPTLTRHNESRHREIIDSCRGECDLVVFPELSLNGYLMMDSVFEFAYTREEIAQFAAEYTDIDLLLGVALREGDAIYNAGVYCAEGGLRHVHHKCALPNYGMFEEARYFFTGERLDVFEARGRKAVVAICEDMWSGSCIEQLLAHRPDVVYVISNSPARGFGEEGLAIESQWESILHTLASLSGAYVVFVNRVGFEDGLGFWGGSRVITPQGDTQVRAPLFEEHVLLCELDGRLSQTRKYLNRNH